MLFYINIEDFFLFLKFNSFEWKNKQIKFNWNLTSKKKKYSILLHFCIYVCVMFQFFVLIFHCFCVDDLLYRTKFKEWTFVCSLIESGHGVWWLDRFFVLFGICSHKANNNGLGMDLIWEKGLFNATIIGCFFSFIIIFKLWVCVWMCFVWYQFNYHNETFCYLILHDSFEALHI